MMSQHHVAMLDDVLSDFLTMTPVNLRLCTLSPVSFDVSDPKTKDVCFCCPTLLLSRSVTRAKGLYPAISVVLSGDELAMLIDIRPSNDEPVYVVGHEAMLVDVAGAEKVGRAKAHMCALIQDFVAPAA